MSLMDSGVAVFGWRKASHSVANGQCVEVASAETAVVVRDSVDASGPVVAYPASVWRSFLANARTGAYDAVL
jgi:hypothetical protein